MILLQMETNAVQKIWQCTGIKQIAVLLSHGMIFRLVWHFLISSGVCEQVVNTDTLNSAEQHLIYLIRLQETSITDNNIVINAFLG